MSEAEKKRPWLHALFTVLLVAAAPLLQLSQSQPEPPRPIAAALKLGNDRTPVCLRGRIEAVNPETPPDLKEPAPAAFYQVRLHRRWFEQHYEKKKPKERLEKSWNHASSFRIKDDSGSILIDGREAFSDQHGEFTPLRSVERYAPASDQRLRIGRIDIPAAPENDEEFWTVERRWLPEGTEVEVTGVVIKGPNGPELSVPGDAKLHVRIVGQDAAKPESSASTWLVYGVLGLALLSLIALVIRWRRSSPAG